MNDFGLFLWKVIGLFGWDWMFGLLIVKQVILVFCYWYCLMRLSVVLLNWCVVSDIVLWFVVSSGLVVVVNFGWLYF